MSDDDDDNLRPYPPGIAWDEAWRQRQRADYFEEAVQLERDERYRRRVAIRYHAALLDIAKRIVDYSNRLEGKGEPIYDIFDDAADLLAKIQREGKK